MIAVVGAGAFGTALAIVWSRGGLPVRLVARSPERAADLAGGENRVSLPGIRFPPSLEVTVFPGDAAIIAYATPAQTFADVLSQHPPDAATTGVICAKGIDAARGTLLPQLANEVVPHGEFAVLSGPGFAGEIARGLPTAMTLASASLMQAVRLAERLSDRRFRLYASDDPLGAAGGGALKNVAALACGMARGLGLGASAEAALATRAARELQRLVVGLGGRAATFSGLSGLGDLMLTCSSPQSRNFRLGEALGRGHAWEGALAEGAHTASVAVRLAARLEVKTPITDAVAAILDRRTTPREAIDDLMRRPLRTETE